MRSAEEPRRTSSTAYSGWCSPAVAGTGGNVTVVCQGVDPKALARLQELLDKKDLELADKIKEADEWVAKYRELEARLASVGDAEATKLIQQGKFEEAGRILDRLIAKQEAQVAELARGASHPCEQTAADEPRRRAVSWWRRSRPQLADQPEDGGEQRPRNGPFDQLERDVPAVAHDLGANHRYAKLR